MSGRWRRRRRVRGRCGVRGRCRASRGAGADASVSGASGAGAIPASEPRKKAASAGDVAGAFAERGQRDFEDVEAVVEILAETSGADFVAEIFVRRGDEPQIDAQVFATAEPGEGALLDEAQQLRLDGGRDVGDFIEEKRAAVGAFEVAGARGQRAGEGAFFVAEEFALEQLLGQRAAVERDERAVAPRAVARG